MTHTWEHLQGVSHNGPYGLEAWLGGDGSSAFFRTSFGPEHQPAVLKLIPQDRVDAEEQLALWRRTGELSHPNLLALLDHGAIEIDNDPYIFAVFEYPDDRLSSALQNGPLTPDEVREVRAAMLDALRYVHAQGMVHGEVDAEHIVAVGESTKLTSDALRDMESAAIAPADDIRALDAVLGEDPVAVPAPYAAPVVPAATMSEMKPSPAMPLPPVEEPVRRLDSRPDGFHFHGLPFWAYATGVVLLALAVFGVTHHSDPSADRAAVTIPAPAAPPPAVAAPSVLPPAAPPSGREYWRVIAYTFTHYGDAEKKAQRINERWPEMQASVFAPLGRNRGPFLVALGGRMTREKAVLLQRSARGRGLPRDTFVRNYAE